MRDVETVTVLLSISLSITWGGVTKESNHGANLGTTSVKTGSEICSDVYQNEEHYLIEDLSACNKFYSCQKDGSGGWIAHPMECPTGTGFDTKLGICNYVGSVQRCNTGWGYHDGCGPSCWDEQFPDCHGRHQSPVDLNKHHTVRGRSVNFNNYEQISKESHFHNNGHTDEDEPVYIGNSTMNGGPLEDDYVLLQLHFHWGHNDSLGSEHTIDGRRFPLEMHLVNKNKNGKGDLAVAGFLFEISPEDNPHLMDVTDHLRDIREPDSEIDITHFSIRDLVLTASKGNYFTYEGSLTTPPCSEIVHWIIFETTLPISSSQLQQFRLTEGEDHKPIVDNFRPTQQLNERDEKYIVISG